MKIFSFVLLLLIFIVSVSSAEQRVVTIYTQATWGDNASFLEYDRKETCSAGGDINAWLSRGWRVLGSSHTSMELRPFKNDYSRCRCIGREYALEREKKRIRLSDQGTGNCTSHGLWLNRYQG